MPTLRIGDDHVAWTAVRSPRARRIRIRVGPEGVVVALPRGVPAAAADAFVAEKAAWIARALRRVARWEAGRDAAAAVMVPEWAEGGAVPYRGGWCAFDVVDTARRRAVVREAAAEADAIGDPPRLTVAVPGHLDAAAREAAVRDAVVGWLRARALDVAEDAADAFGRRLGRAPSAVRVGDARTRWGSCAGSGVVRVAWRLIMAPPEALAYVVAHEVAHLAEPNHGPGFWATVARIHPGWADGKARLREWERSGRAAAAREV